MSAGFEELGKSFGRLDPTLKKSVEKEKGKVIHSIEGLRGRAVRAHKTSASVTEKRFGSSHYFIQPSGGPTMKDCDLAIKIFLLTVVMLLPFGCYQKGNQETDFDTPCMINGGKWLVEQVEDWVDEVDGSGSIYLKSGEVLRMKPGQRFRESWLIWIQNSLENGDLASFFINPPDKTVLRGHNPTEPYDPKT